MMVLQRGSRPVGLGMQLKAWEWAAVVGQVEIYEWTILDIR